MRDEEIKEIDDDEFFEQIEEESLDDDMETSGPEKEDAPAVPEEKPEEEKKEDDAVPIKKRNNNNKKHKEESKVQHKKPEHHSERREKSHESHGHAKQNKSNIWIWIISAVVIIGLIAVAINYEKIFKPNTVTLKDNVLANVNGEDITEMELETQYNRLPPQSKLLITKENLLEQMIDEKLLLQDAKKKGITKTDAEVDDFLTATVTSAGLSMSEFEKGIADKNITLDEVKTFFKNQLIVTELLNKTIIEKINVSDSDITDYYNAHKADYYVGETILASHILVNTSDEARQILTKLKAGESFEDLAVKYSIDPSAKLYNGSLGWFGKGEMVKEFEDAAFALNVNEVAGPVKTSFGYHIIKVYGKKPAGQLALEDVKDAITTQVTYEKQKTMYADYIKGLRDSAKIVRKQATTATADNQTTGTDTGSTETLSAEATLAKCLSDKGAKLYSASWCGNCKTQKEMFKDGLQYLSQVECANPDNSITKECSDAGVKAVPTWYIGGQMVPGKKELSDLAKLAGCTYK